MPSEQETLEQRAAEFKLAGAPSVETHVCDLVLLHTCVGTDPHIRGARKHDFYYYRGLLHA